MFEKSKLLLGSYNFDSAVQYVGEGPGQAGAYQGFKPTLCRTQQKTPPRWQRLEGALDGFPEAVAYREQLEAGSYDNVQVFRLYLGRNSTADGGGTLCPMTPPLPQDDGSFKQIAMTARHCVAEKVTGAPLLSLKCTTAPYTSWQSVLEEARLKVSISTPKIEASIKDDRRLPLPGSPNRYLPTDMPEVDIAAVTISYRPEQERQTSWFFVPSADGPTPGEEVVLVGYGGAPKPGWAALHLLKPDELKWNPDDIELPEALRRIEPLNMLEVSSHLDALTYLAIHPHQMALSLGTVQHCNDKVVEHTASVVPGFSVSPGFKMVEPSTILFLQIQSQLDPRRPHAFGLSVHHPYFAATYMKTVLPELYKDHLELLGEDKLRAIWAYVEHFKRTGPH